MVCCGMPQVARHIIDNDYLSAVLFFCSFYSALLKYAYAVFGH